MLLVSVSGVAEVDAGGRVVVARGRGGGKKKKKTSETILIRKKYHDIFKMMKHKHYETRIIYQVKIFTKTN